MPTTREFVARQTLAGRTKKEIIRLLKRAIAREVVRRLTSPVQVPEIADLRPTRLTKNITLTAAANHSHGPHRTRPRECNHTPPPPPDPERFIRRSSEILAGVALTSCLRATPSWLQTTRTRRPRV
jgi:hypothetical protein